MTESSGNLPHQKNPRRGMVDSIKLENFKAFADAELNGFALINLIVGDNGVGKTSLMEAIHLALSGNPSAHLSSRTWRGMDPRFNFGSFDQNADGTYGDLFRDPKKQARIEIRTSSSGAREFENRSVTITKSKDVVFQLPFIASAESSEETENQVGMLANPVVFIWKGADGREHVIRTFIKGSQITIPGTGEELPSCSYFAVTNAINTGETASNFSLLRKARKDREFKIAFRQLFEMVHDISVEAVAGESVLMADLGDRMIPLAMLSGGINRAAAILLAIAQREDGVVMVDDAESGIYHRRLEDFGRAIISVAREYRTQLMLTTHSDEWLKHFVSAAGDRIDDIALWRIERGTTQSPVVRRFVGKDMRRVILTGEPR